MIQYFESFPSVLAQPWQCPDPKELAVTQVTQVAVFVGSFVTRDSDYPTMGTLSPGEHITSYGRYNHS